MYNDKEDSIGLYVDHFKGWTMGVVPLSLMCNFMSDKPTALIDTPEKWRKSVSNHGAIYFKCHQFQIISRHIPHVTYDHA